MKTILTRNKVNLKKIILTLVFLTVEITSVPQIIYKNKGTSESVGKVSNGKLINAYKLPRKGDNFKYYSLFSYYVIGRCYIHSGIHKTILESYTILEKENPKYTYRIMDCSKRKGGRLFPHKTHQNGTSVDFMTPLIKKGKQTTFFDKISVFRYLMKFDSKGKSRINKKVEIDFESVAQHILILDKTARKNGFKIRKVILETNLKDELFATKYGAELKERNIYFVKSLPKVIDELHDDHYHIDFVKI